ncbi:homogentisate 1,2-dioxygenase [Sphingomonas naasensis]|uniref:Homogentisate 1,2-dioxygenase n=2 Tax=Sphingomonas naasensis TaxID=1344951 RepID=A0A4S1WQ89_9SPHN|nr:homogentisate 1,2-dioxygenase [Sphingomonas naasensis]
MAGTAAALLMAGPALAQHAQPDCAADAVPLPPELAGWLARGALSAAIDTLTLRAATVQPGRAVDLALVPTPSVRYALRPERPGGSVSHGGMVGFTVERAGTYRVAIGSAAWIDLVQGGKALASVGHGPGPACSGIRKMVDFALEPGSYVLQIAGNGAPTLPVLVTRLP